jgi:hypothetical protein
MEYMVLKYVSVRAEIVAMVDYNAFDDQIIDVVREYQDGTKESVYSEVNKEGSHRSRMDIYSLVEEKGFL